MSVFQSKLPHVGQTIFTEMSQLAQEYDAINLGQGFPNYPMDGRLIDLVDRAMKDGYNQYAHSNGLPLLRQKIAEKIEFLYQTKINFDTQITITPGGTYAIYTALTTILHPGDEVIVFEPAYDSYTPNIELNQAIPVYISLRVPDYSIPWAEVRQKVNAKTKAIVINSPHNPTGRILTETDIAALHELVRKFSLYIVSDEVYEHLIYDGARHLSMLRYPELLEKSFVCFSFGKTYNCTGWKLGYAIAPPLLMQEFRKIHQFNCFSCFTPAQVAIAQFLDEKEAYLQLGKQMQAKRDFLQKALQDAPFTPLPSHGSYFQCYEYNGPLTETGIELAKKITKDFGVATIPVSAFYHDGGTPNPILRFCFSKTDPILENAAKKLQG